MTTWQWNILITIVRILLKANEKEFINLNHEELAILVEADARDTS